MFPFFTYNPVSTTVEYITAVILGMAFGIALEQSGFGNSKKMSLMFYFKDMTVFKVMFGAIALTLAGFTFTRLTGILNWDEVYLNPTVVIPGIIGGVIMGAGFVIGGYCPGTSFVGVVSKKYDAMFYMGGMMFGMLLFGETETLWAEIYRKTGSLSGFMGDRITLDQVFGIPYWVMGLIIIAVAVGGFFGVEVIEKKRGEIVQPTDSK